jgi:tetratricopeptide (TPR) repeat protein
MAVEEFRCINCGSNEYVINEEKGVKKCRYCGTEYEDTENTYTCKRIAEYIDLDQFEEARRICELYLEKEPKNATLHWQRFQIRNSIKFVVDPVTKERKPTFRSESFTRDTVLKDDNLLKAIEYSTGANKQRYENWANLIEEIRLEICDKISQRDNYDIFISFKATREVTESNGDKSLVDTRDRQIAKEIYEFFTKEGYRVFFSDVALGKDKRKVGEKYEPTIFAALASCRAMILVGTKEEYVNYGWVKDEWSRYFYFMNIKGGIDSRLKKKEGTVFYVFDREIPRGLPEEISSLQGIDYDRRDEFFDTLLDLVSTRIGHGANRAGIERIELGKVVGKKAKTANVDSLGTVELGSGNAAPRQQKSIEGNLVVKKFGLNKVRKVDSSIEDDLKAIGLLINNKRFAPANAKIDDILSKGDNADAYFYKILCSLEARNEEEFIEYANTFDNFELFEKALDCSDKDSAKRLTDMFVAGYVDCFDDGYYNSAILFFNQLIKYDIDRRDEVISTMKSRIFELLSSGEEDELLIRLIDSYLLSVDPNDIDNYISECLGFAHSAHVNDKIAVAQHFMKKVKEIDEGNPEVTMFNLMLQTGSSSPDQLIDNICKIEDLNDIVSLIKNSSSEQASMCMQIFVEGVKKALTLGDIDVNKPLEIFKTLLTFNFDERESAKNDVFNVFCLNIANGVSYDETVAFEFVDYLLKATSAEDVDEHIYINKNFAITMRKAGKFEIAKKYLNKVLELDNADLQARFNLVLALAECEGDDISSSVSKFKDEDGEVIKATAELLNYSLHEGVSGEYSYKGLITLFTDSIFSALTNKACSEADADSAYCNIVRYIQDDEKDLLVERLLKMGKYLIAEREFALASKYFKLVLEEDAKNFDARWNCMLIELGCISDFDVIAADMPLESCVQYNETLTCANPEQVEHICSLANKQEMLKGNPELAKKYDAIVSDPNTTNDIKEALAKCKDDNFESKVEKYHAEILERERKEKERKRRELEEERKRLAEEERKKKAERERRRREAKRARREATAKAFSRFFLVFVLLVGALAGFGAHMSFGIMSSVLASPEEIQKIIVMATCVAVAIVSFIAYVRFKSGLKKLEMLICEILILLELVIFGMFIIDSIILSLVISGVSISALSVYIKCKAEDGSNCISIFFVNLIATILISATYYFLKFVSDTNLFYKEQLYVPIIAILVEMAMYILTLVFTAKQVYSNYEGKKAFANVIAYILYSITFVGFAYGILVAGHSVAMYDEYFYTTTPTLATLPWILLFGGTTITSITLFLYDLYEDQTRIAWLTWLFYTIFEVLTFLLGSFVISQYNTVFENLVAFAGVIFGFVKMNIKNFRDQWKGSIIWLLIPFILLFVVAIFGAIGQACTDGCGDCGGSGGSDCGDCGGGCGCGGCGGGIGGLVFVILVIIGIFKKDD